MTWFQQDVDTTIQKLKSDATEGLSESEAGRRLAQYGLNELIEKGTKNPWLILLDQLRDAMVIILIIAAIVSGFLGDFKDVIVILAIVILNAAIGFSQEYRAEQAIAALKKLAVPTVKVRRDGHIVEISARELVPGDLVLLEAGNLVPADGRLVESINLKVEEAALTGESEPVEKITEPIDKQEIPIGDRKNMVFMGTVITY
ncbi:MAG: HAD-IC family P-type ATPase, partial [Anaerolineales bacterium]|nr:HAD-IC family P-type ATPase [Anaerolineales bacterium]